LKWRSGFGVFCDHRKTLEIEEKLDKTVIKLAILYGSATGVLRNNISRKQVWLK